MYNAHRGMGAPANRLDEYIQGIRQEFESASTRAGEHDQTRKSVIPILSRERKDPPNTASKVRNAPCPLLPLNLQLWSG